jgi:diguanylate cyclase (GGDEF)-like protein
MGHLMGDALLTQVAQRLKACLREGDSVARIGGDEFVVLVENLDELEMDAASQAGVIGEKIMTQLNLPFQLGERKYHNTASIGIAMKTDETLDFEMLFKQADIAMYQAKRSGRNALRFFDPKMQEYNDEKALLENDLREALEENQLYLQYQIQVNNVKHPTGVEALVRWKHPKRGDVYPSEFIPMAEETGLILPIGAWVLRTACQQLKAWEAHIATSKLVIAVNVSARQFHQANFVEQLTAMVKHYAISPNLLKLELTESMLIDNVQDAIVKMQLLKEIGIRISLDDFGTGYSSLQYLKLLPLDQLKIDQSFIKDLNRDRGSGAIVSTIIAMARGLKINVIAEGVETEEQRDFLENVGCIHFQGYLFGKPMDINEVEQVISQYFYA